MSHSALRRATLFFAGALAALAILAPAAFGAGKPIINFEAPSSEDPGISLTVAHLKGTINPNGTETCYWVEYGKTKLYGNATPHICIGKGEAPVTVYPELVGLEGMTTYHFRVVANETVTTPDITFENLNDWKVGSRRVTKLFSGEPVGFEDTSSNGYFELQGMVGVSGTRIRCAQSNRLSGVLGVSITNPEYSGCSVWVSGVLSSCKVTPFVLGLNGQLAQTTPLKIKFNEGCSLGKELEFNRGGLSVPQSPQSKEFKSELWGVTFTPTSVRWDMEIGLEQGKGLPGSWILNGAEAGHEFGVGL